MKLQGEEWIRVVHRGSEENSNSDSVVQKIRPACQERTGQRTVADRAPVRPYARVAIKDKKRITFVTIVDIVSIEAQGNYVLLHRRSQSTLLREAISRLARKLEAYGFIRIHRSVLINVLHVENVELLTNGDYRVVLYGDRHYTVTRSYKDNLPNLAAIWIGSFGFYRKEVECASFH